MQIWTLRSQNHNGSTPLLWVTDKENVSLVRELIDLGANVRLKDPEGRTPRKLAEKYGTPKMVRMLKKAGG